MEYKTEGCSLTLPDTVTVREQLRYASAVSFEFDNKEKILAWWEGAKLIIDKWECEAIPDYKNFDIDTSEDPDHANIIAWAASTCFNHMMRLRNVPKK